MLKAVFWNRIGGYLLGPLDFVIKSDQDVEDFSWRNAEFHQLKVFTFDI